MIDVIRFERQKGETLSDDAPRAQHWMNHPAVNSVTIYRVDGLPANPVTMTQTEPDPVMPPSPLFDGAQPFWTDSKVSPEEREQLVKELLEREAQLQASATVDRNIAGRLFRFTPNHVPTAQDIDKLEVFLADCREDKEQHLRIVCVWVGNGAVAGLAACLERERPAVFYVVTTAQSELLEENISEWFDFGHLKIIKGDTTHIADSMTAEEVDGVIFGPDAPEDAEQQTKDMNAWQARVKGQSSKRCFVVDWKA